MPLPAPVTEDDLIQQGLHPPTPPGRGSGWVQPLLNKIVWVTGAGSGIGEAAALTLAKAGAAVVLTGRRREPLETVADRIRAEGGTAHVEPGDLMDPDAVKRIGALINDKSAASTSLSTMPGSTSTTGTGTS